jgi:formamidopyrimidine-DNA glycosylase
VPELPDVEVYVERLRALVLGRTLRAVRLRSPFLLRTVDPPLGAAEGRSVRGVRRLGKRIVIELDDGIFLVLHLVVAGRLHWRAPGAAIPGRIGLAALDFPHGTLVVTEAGSKRRTSLHVVRGDEALRQFERGGLEVMEAGPEAFAAALARENHTLKRALTDPRILSGIGNAYSDEILHRARLSPLKQTGRLTRAETRRLYQATRAVLAEWTERLSREAGEGLPEGVTAFREEMAVHGRYGRPCPVCRAPVQRIVYAENETNYCARCQTGGRLLADRALSRILRDDWPRSIDDLE